MGSEEIALEVAQTGARAHQPLGLWPRVILDIAYKGKGADKFPFLSQEKVSFPAPIVRVTKIPG
jgi:hypothetical protein